jgi:8-oxo-dGTP diphosphatase
MSDETRAGEREWLAAYDPRAFDPVAVTCDIVALTLRGGRLHVLLVRRGAPPFEGYRALPGGFVHAGREDLDAAAARELAEETGLDAAGLGRVHLEQLGSYGSPDRDPRMHVVSVAYLALAPDLPDPRAGTDAAAAAWIPVDELDLDRPPRDHPDGDPPNHDHPRDDRPDLDDPDGGPSSPERVVFEQSVQPLGRALRPMDRNRRAGAHGGGPTRRFHDNHLAFDHARILTDALDRARSKIEYTPLATAFLGEDFTISELRAVYEAIWGGTLHAGNFHRKVLSVPGFVESTGTTAARGGTRGGPRARLYRAGDARLLHPALLRPDREDSVR